MTALPELQRLFAACLDDNIDSGRGMHFFELLVDRQGLSPRERVAVYRGSSREARLSALELVFPVCVSILGQRCFRALSSTYLDGTPSRSGDLNLYGETFPRFIERSTSSFEGLAGLDYLADLARLEWHWHAVYYAPEDPPFNMEAFALASSGAGAEQIRFRLSAAMRLLASEYPVHEIWRRHRDGGDTESVAIGAGDRLLIRREGFFPRVESTKPDLFALLAAILDGHSLGALAADGLDLEPLPGLIAAGWIAGFDRAGD